MLLLDLYFCLVPPSLPPPSLLCLLFHFFTVSNLIYVLLFWLGSLGCGEVSVRKTSVFSKYLIFALHCLSLPIPGQDLVDSEGSQTEDLTGQGRVVGVHLHHLLELALPPLPHRAQHQQRRRGVGGGGGGEDWSELRPLGVSVADINLKVESEVTLLDYNVVDIYLS